MGLCGIIAHEERCITMDDIKEKDDVEKMNDRNRFWNGFYDLLTYALLGIAAGLCGRMVINGFFGM